MTARSSRSAPSATDESSHHPCPPPRPASASVSASVVVVPASPLPDLPPTLGTSCHRRLRAVRAHPLAWVWRVGPVPQHREIYVHMCKWGNFCSQILIGHVDAGTFFFVQPHFSTTEQFKSTSVSTNNQL
jgi:hypothetical protein